MVNTGPPPDPARALDSKEKGNKCFQAGDYVGAEAFYSQAITYDPTNHIYYTNRAMALLKLSNYESVISSSLQALSLQPANMKAHFQLGQAHIALHDPSAALVSAKKALELCMQDVYTGGKNASSLEMVTKLVHQCRKEEWEVRELERVKREEGLLGELVRDLDKKKDMMISIYYEQGRSESEVENIRRDFPRKIEDLRDVFDRAGTVKKRVVPEWCLDDISFAVMVDPVVTKTGQSYDRASIMEHLKRAPTDPLTREPLSVADLRPNLALREACEEFLDQNGWAVDW